MDTQAKEIIKFHAVSKSMANVIFVMSTTTTSPAATTTLPFALMAYCWSPHLHQHTGSCCGWHGCDVAVADGSPHVHAYLLNDGHSTSSPDCCAGHGQAGGADARPVAVAGFPPAAGPGSASAAMATADASAAAAATTAARSGAGPIFRAAAAAAAGSCTTACTTAGAAAAAGSSTTSGAAAAARNEPEGSCGTAKLGHLVFDGWGGHLPVPSIETAMC